MHANMSLFKDARHNAFYDENDKMQLSQTAYHFIGGVLHRIREITAVTNPIVNSYKRLVSGFEAPVYVAYSDANRSALIRIPASRGLGTRCELRMVDPSANPYLAMALVLAAGLEGIREQRDPGEPTRRDIFQMSPTERLEAKIVSIAGDLEEATDQFSQSTFAGRSVWPCFCTGELCRPGAITGGSANVKRPVDWYFTGNSSRACHSG